jgi:predicted RNA-binding protein with PUA-like domain
MEIVRTAYPDSTCTDPRSKYYDQKADSDDKWVCVDCKLIETFTRPILLDEMKSHDELKEMETFKRSRLSVSHVTKSEFDFICNLGRNTEVPPPQSTNKKRKATDEEKSETVVKKKSSKKAN